MMDEALNNQVIKSIEDTYLKEFNNKYTVFLGAMCQNLLENFINRYGMIVTTDLEANINWTKNNIQLYSPIGNYFVGIDNCIQYIYN